MDSSVFYYFKSAQNTWELSGNDKECIRPRLSNRHSFLFVFFYTHFYKKNSIRFCPWVYNYKRYTTISTISYAHILTRFVNLTSVFLLFHFNSFKRVPLYISVYHSKPTQHYDGSKTNLRLKLKSYIITVRFITANLLDGQIKRI